MMRRTSKIVVRALFLGGIVGILGCALLGRPAAAWAGGVPASTEAAKPVADDMAVAGDVDAESSPEVSVEAVSLVGLTEPIEASDQIWMVGSRGVGHDCSETSAEKLKYWRYDCRHGWRASSREVFEEEDDARLTTLVWVHGNRVRVGSAGSQGLAVYRALSREAREDQPVRFVVWSWPSDTAVLRPIRDVRIKAARSDVAGYYLGWWIDKIAPERPVSLIGYSLGSRVITGALHLLGGGRLGGRQLAETPRATGSQITGSQITGPHMTGHQVTGHQVIGRQKPRRLRAVLLAAAVDRTWLLPGRPHGQALSTVDRMVLVLNGCDRALRRYRLVTPGRGGPSALGYTGLAGLARLGEDAERVEQFSASSYVGKRHDWRLYFRSRTLTARIQDGTSFSRAK